MMQRRSFLNLLGTLAAAWPVVARAQPAIPVIGFLDGAVMSDAGMAAFHQGLSEGGYVAGRNVTIESRVANGQYDRLPTLAAELVQASPGCTGT